MGRAAAAAAAAVRAPNVQASFAVLFAAGAISAAIGDMMATRRRPKASRFANLRFVALETAALWFIYGVLEALMRHQGWAAAPNLAAKQVVSFICIMLTAIPGGRFWWAPASNPEAASTIEDRVHGYSRGGELVACNFLAYQVFDTIVSFHIKELRSPLMIAHHMVSGTLALWMSVSRRPFCQYYCIFFGGVCEISSIFYCIISYSYAVAGLSPAQIRESGHAVATGSGYHAQGILLCKVLFLVSFFWIRVFLFIRHSRDFWTDAKALVRDPKSKYYDRFRACVFMAVNLLLIALQLYWGWALLLAAKKTALGE